MAPSKACSTEDAIQALLEYLVSPLLPTKSSVRDNPSSSQQLSVAKQVHSVILLYNYYYRKEHPELQFLTFDDFCKLAVIIKPTLLAYLNFMQQSDESQLDDVEKQLSVTEKMIMDACDICTCLDASKSVPNTEGWPISKVSVLLIDSKKENCVLEFSTITKGVWSLVEKDVDISIQISDNTKGIKSALKKRKVIKKPSKDKLNVDDAGFLQIGYSAVKEANGINQTDIEHLESYTVYSHSKEKTASLFYIMQCSQLVNQEVFQTPIKDVIHSLQGSLFNKSCSIWTVTSVVEHFHLLPYAEVISGRLSRITCSTSSQDSMLVEEIMSVGLDSNNAESLNLEENNQSYLGRQSDSCKEPQDMDVEDCSVSPYLNTEKYQNVANSVKVDEDQEIENLSTQNQLEGSASAVQNVAFSIKVDEDQAKENLSTHNHLEGSASPVQNVANSVKVEDQEIENLSTQNHLEGYASPVQNVAFSIKVDEDQEIENLSTQNHLEEYAIPVQVLNADTTKLLITGDGIHNLVAGSKICTNTTVRKDTIHERGLVTSQFNSSDPENFQAILTSKGEQLTQTSLAALEQRRNKLVLQHRMIEDEIALCDKKIQTILTDGKDALESKIEVIIESCNDTCVRNQDRTSQNLEDCCLPSCIKGKRLSEAVLSLQSPSQELDGVCRENNWILPTYCVSQSDGGFEATVTVKGIDFDQSCGGKTCSNPRKARESAAAQMLDILRIKAKSIQ